MSVDPRLTLMVEMIRDVMRSGRRVGLLLREFGADEESVRALKAEARRLDCEIELDEFASLFDSRPDA